jgi:hypothetical protein
MEWMPPRIGLPSAGNALQSTLVLVVKRDVIKGHPSFPVPLPLEMFGEQIDRTALLAIRSLKGDLLIFLCVNIRICSPTKCVLVWILCHRKCTLPAFPLGFIFQFAPPLEFKVWASLSASPRSIFVSYPSSSWLSFLHQAWSPPISLISSVIICLMTGSH